MSTEGTPIIMDEETFKLFLLFQQYREPFQIMANSGMFESPNSQWKLSFNPEGVLTNVFILDKVVYKR